MMRLLRVVAALVSLLVVTGCVSTYRLPSDQSSATMSFDLSSDSTGTTGKAFILTTFDDLNCAPSKYGSKLDSKAFANDREQLGPLRVAAGKPLTFAVTYSESRFAQNRACSFTASFLPLPEQAYTVRFAVVDQSAACGLQIADGGGSEVRYEAPELSCAETLAGKVKNGGAGILNWKFEVIRQPGR